MNISGKYGVGDFLKVSFNFLHFILKYTQVFSNKFTEDKHAVTIIICTIDDFALQCILKRLRKIYFYEKIHDYRWKK